jgi:drug/metabolite transporter (DMT)-like permease
MAAAKPLVSLLAVAALVTNAAIWGMSWWPFRELQQGGLHPLWATAAVYLLIFLGLSALQPRAWRFLLAQPQLGYLALAAGLTNVCFNWAVTVGDVVRVVLLFYLMPAWTVLVAWILLDEKPTTASLLRLVMAMTGVLIVLKTPGSAWPLPNSVADGLALLGGFCFALTNVLLLKLKAADSSARMLAMFAGGAALPLAVASLGLAFSVLPAPALQLALWPVLVVLTVLFVVSNVGLQYGASRLAATTTSLVMLTEIVFAGVSAALLGATDLSPRLFWGGSLIVLAALWAALAHHQTQA